MGSMDSELGSVFSLWRYPVKSMMGEALASAEVKEYGVVGDRAYALVAEADGKVASAKNPGKWPSLFAFHAAFLQHAGDETAFPPIRITLPDGKTVSSQQQDVNLTLSKALGKNVILAVTEGGRISGVQSPMHRPHEPAGIEIGGTDVTRPALAPLPYRADDRAQFLSGLRESIVPAARIV